MRHTTDLIQQEAIRWYTRMREAAADAPERSRFEAWLLMDVRHQHAYRLVEQTMEDFSSLQRVEQLHDAMRQKRYFEQSSKKKTLSKLGSGLATLLLCCGLSWLALTQYQTWQLQPVSQETQVTAIAQMSKRTLADGSKVIANANTRLEIAFYRHQRVVNLVKGEAIFEVAKDSQRPFIVQTKLANVRVVGTRFAVNLLTKTVRISVDHGIVVVTDANGQHALTLQAGQVAEVGQQAPHLVKRNAEDAFAFTRKLVIFDQADMFEVAETLSRYRQPPIHALFFGEHTPQVNAVLSMTQIEDFIRTLPSAVPVSLKQHEQQLEIRPR